MAKRRKRRTTTRRKKDSGRFGAMLFGVVVGIGLAGAALWLLTPAEERPSLPVVEAPAKATPKAKTKAPKPIQPSGEGYDFYEMLPEQEVLIDDTAATAAAGPQQPRAARDALAEPGLYVLQAGAFRNADSAERIKAELALLGLVARVRPVPGADGTLHQVRVGPVDRDTANDYLRRVAETNIDVRVFSAQP